jgi:hypothetical protein
MNIYSSERTRINLNTLMQPTKEKDTNKSHRTIDHDRTFVIQVCYYKFFYSIIDCCRQLLFEQ